MFHLKAEVSQTVPLEILKAPKKVAFTLVCSFPSSAENK